MLHAAGWEVDRDMGHVHNRGCLRRGGPCSTTPQVSMAPPSCSSTRWIFFLKIRSTPFKNRNILIAIFARLGMQFGAGGSGYCGSRNKSNGSDEYSVVWSRILSLALTFVCYMRHMLLSRSL